MRNAGEEINAIDQASMQMTFDHTAEYLETALDPNSSIISDMGTIQCLGMAQQACSAIGSMATAYISSYYQSKVQGALYNSQSRISDMRTDTADQITEIRENTISMAKNIGKRGNQESLALAKAQSDLDIAQARLNTQRGNEESLTLDYPYGSPLSP